MTPPQVDALSLVDIAMMLGRNRSIPRDPWPEDAPDIRTVRRGRARDRGLPAPGRDDPIGDDEYRELYKLVTGGKRKGT